MLPLAKIYAGKITPRQIKDLLGIYQDYLYFERGFETIIKNNTMMDLSGFFMEQAGWKKDRPLPWSMLFTTAPQQDLYTKFANGDVSEPKHYSFMSLYHTKKEMDAPVKKISVIPGDYEYTSIDLNLPCPIERYAAFYPIDQKLKDMCLLVDGKFEICYTGDQYAEMKVLDALHSMELQKEFRAMINYLEFYNRNFFDIESNPDTKSQKLFSAMLKITAEEVLSFHENCVLDLLGSYADKAHEILSCIYPDKTTKEVWQSAEKDKLISSAENMNHCLNIRNLVRHQWDSLNGTTRYSFDSNEKNEKKRDENLASYHLLTDKSIAERIKGYQKITVEMQTLLKAFYPNFLTRETGETNSKFVHRIKQWQKDNLAKIPLITGNYPIKDEKHKSLVNNLKKVAPTAVVLDNVTDEDFKKQSYVEQIYFLRTSFLRIYNRVESGISMFCINYGMKLKKPEEAWQFFKKNIFNEEEAEKWEKYRLLRNQLSHNHLNDDMKQELDEIFVTFQKDAIQLDDYVYDNMPSHNQISDNKQANRQNDVATKKIADTTQKEKPVQERKKINYPLKLTYGEGTGEIAECQFDNGIIVDFNRKKVTFQDNTRLYFDAKEFNVFRFENGNKIFTDKTFMVTKFQERGHFQKIRRNETVMAAPKHKISTNNTGRISEDCIITEDNKRHITKINYTNTDGSVITFADGTKLKALNDKLVLSHNNVVLTYANRHAFKKSYLTVQSSSRER